MNVTPDSFADGGKFLDPESAVAHGLEQIAQGAELLDIGGESTRPGAQPVAEAEELRRVIPVIKKLAAQTKVPLSIDTVKPAVARAALEAGASIVNDVGAFRSDRHMWGIVAEFHAGYVAMHAPSLPGTMPPEPTGGNIINAVAEFFSERLIALLNESGIAPEQVVLDPGIGFGKSLEQNLQLLGNLGSFTKWRRPLLLGVSRKSFIEKLTGAKLIERLPGSLACAALAVKSGVNLVRVHDVAETAQAVRVAEAILRTSNVD
ncbi:MAG TPA: dihydropteroate synthase [Candidatus Acidoferrales bacterium]|nr:dihydropteroate synthase [Candidatus Acidoferrales bacterium]